MYVEGREEEVNGAKKGAVMRGNILRLFSPATLQIHLHLKFLGKPNCRTGAECQMKPDS